MKKNFLLIGTMAISLGLLFTACDKSSEKGKELQTKMLKVVGIPQDVIANICQDENKNGVCESMELQAKVSFKQGDSMETILSKLTQTEDGRYLLETYDPSKPLLLELKNEKSKYFKNIYALPFNGFKSDEYEKELSLLQTMIDKGTLSTENVSSARVMKNVDEFYAMLLSDFEYNMNILTKKGLSTKQAVQGNIKEIADELILNGIENRVPAGMNSCNGDKKCIDAVLNPLSKEVRLTDSEADAVVKEQQDEGGDSDNNHQDKIDFAEYLPKTSMVKNFTQKFNSPMLAQEYINQHTENIERKDNIVTYIGEDGEGESRVTINSDKILIDSTYSSKIDRYINRGDTIWEWHYAKEDENYKYTENVTCKLEDILNNFSHGGYSYSGEIIVEKCFRDDKTTYKDGNNQTQTITSTGIYFSYSKKDIGTIAYIEDICYNEQGIPKTVEGCTPNGYHYDYLEQ